jgi:hypothetical protein
MTLNPPAQLGGFFLSNSLTRNSLRSMAARNYPAWLPLPIQPKEQKMMESSTRLPANVSQRCRILHVAAHVVRQHATRDGFDFEGWRLSRLMREAETEAQATFAEQKYNDWQQIN